MTSKWQAKRGRQIKSKVKSPKEVFEIWILSLIWHLVFGI